MGANNKKLTIKEVKLLLQGINSDVIILDDVYIGNKAPMNCECLVCENKFLKTWNTLSKGQGCPACGKNGIKITKQEIREHVAGFGYEIVRFTNDDSNKGTMFIIKCPEKHEYETSYREFNREQKRSRSCKQCNKDNIGLARRKNPKEVMDNLLVWGYSVGDDFVYQNSITNYKFTCRNGHVREISYYSLERSPKCHECNGNPLKRTEEDIIEILNNMGLKYICGFISVSEPFMYKCECGRTVSGKLKAIRKGIRCSKCNKHKRYTIEDINELFSSEGYKLLAVNYVDSKTPLEFICNQGHEHHISLNSFLRGIRCAKCHFERMSGENSPSWNPNLTEDERMKNRKYPEYQKWRISVYNRDNYTCQCCGDNNGGNLNAHHLDSHDWAKDKRVDVDNGITLCDICHNDFHMMYGYGCNTKEQFEEYM